MRSVDMGKALYTIGYEGINIDSFIAKLHDNKIECVIDVRALPLSRKPGFSKTPLSLKLLSAKIQYIHLGKLGTPKRIREELKSSHNYSAFFKKMSIYLSDKQDLIDIAHNHTMNSTCCLMCFEKNVEQCHRKIVAEKIKATNGNGLLITHLMVNR